IRDDEFPMTGDLLKGVARGRIEGPVTGFQTGLHAVANLTLVLVAFQFRGRREDGFDEDFLGLVAELVRGALQFRPERLDGLAEGEMPDDVAGESLDVVDNDYKFVLVFFGVEEVEHLLHALPIDHAARNPLIPEHRRHLKSPALSVLPTTQFLAVETVAFL